MLRAASTNCIASAEVLPQLQAEGASTSYYSQSRCHPERTRHSVFPSVARDLLFFEVSTQKQIPRRSTPRNDSWGASSVLVDRRLTCTPWNDKWRGVPQNDRGAPTCKRHDGQSGGAFLCNLSTEPTRQTTTEKVCLLLRLGHYCQKGVGSGKPLTKRRARLGLAFETR
jgi:hypothetical protein